MTPENEAEGIYLIHTQTVVGEKLPLGNGTEGKDVYKLEEKIVPGSAVERDYKVIYYGEKDNKKEIGTLTDNNGVPFDAKLSPGLYKEGTSQLIKSWDELIEDGDINIYGTELSAISPTIESGKLIISRDITSIGFLIRTPTCGEVLKTEHDVAITSVYIPSSVKSISSSFVGFRKLKTVVIEEGLETIEGGTFRECSSLENINIPNSVKEIVGNRLFYGCTSLKSVVIPNSKASLMSSMDTMFKNCTSLVSVRLPEEGEMKYNYGNYNGMFDGCSSLVDVTLPNSITEIGEYAFDGCSNLTEINIPNSVKKIGAYAFHGCNKLANIKIPDKVTSIGAYAFYECNNLQNVNVPTGITEIGEATFYKCNQLKEINLPTGIVKIGKKAFYKCNQLANVNIPEGVTEIGEKTFGRCVNLSSIVIPKTVTKIDNTTFMQCNHLKNIQVNSENTKFDSRNNCNAIIQKDNNTLLLGCATTTIPNDVTGIGPLAFADNDLTSITIPTGVTSINGFAFAYCDNLKRIQVEEGNTVYDSRNNCNAVIETSSNKLILGCSETTIPDDVIAIGDASFSGATNLTIPAQINSISWGAFSYCDNLKNIQVDKGNTVYDSRDNSNVIVDSKNRLVFACGEITLPENLTMPAYTWMNMHNTSLNSLTIPSSIDIKQGAGFMFYEALESVIIQEGSTSISPVEFGSCENLISVTIPKGVNTIGYNAFSGCENLSSIILPEGVTSIGNKTFYGCANLEEVDVPKSVETIDRDAFGNCGRLKIIKVHSPNIEGTPPWGAISSERINWLY